MAVLDTSGFPELNEFFKRTANIPDSVKMDALNKMAEVVESKQKSTGESMKIRDSESSEHVLDSFKIKKPVLTEDGGSITITFQGSRRRGNITTRNAEIAFINEFGKTNVDAKPFMGTGLELSTDKAVEEALKIIQGWLESN